MLVSLNPSLFVLTSSRYGRVRTVQRTLTSWLVATLGAAVLATGLLGCAGSKPATEEVQSEAPADTSEQVDPRAGFRMLAVSGDGLIYRQGSENPEVLAPADELLGAVTASPDERYLTASVARGDSAAFLLIDRKRLTVRTIDRRARPIVHSAAWSPEGGRLAFGYYVPEGDLGPRDGWGAGGIRTADLEGRTSSVGCQSARKVLKWLPNGQLAVRSAENLFLVESDGCATVTAQDARRLFHLTYSPQGDRLAYVYRELVYDDQAVEYVPDSTLFIAEPTGKDSTEIVGNDYRARHLEFAPDGSELAFDVRSQEDTTRRQIILYEVAADRLTYLIPPNAAGSESELHPRFSPSGDRVAYTLARESGRYAAVRNVGQTTTLGEVEGAVWGWVGNQRLVVPGPDAHRVVDLKGETLLELPASWSLVDVWHRLPS